MKNTLILVTGILFFAEQAVAQSNSAARKAEPGVIRLDCGIKERNDTPPLYVLRTKQAETIIDSTKLKQLSPKKIQSIDVLKSQDALKQYGKEAEHGVILITVDQPTFKAIVGKDD